MTPFNMKLQLKSVGYHLRHSKTRDGSVSHYGSVIKYKVYKGVNSKLQVKFLLGNAELCSLTEIGKK